MHFVGYRWLTSLFSGKKARRGTKPDLRARWKRRYRPWIDVLENRVNLSTFVVSVNDAADLVTEIGLANGSPGSTVIIPNGTYDLTGHGGELTISANVTSMIRSCR